MLRDSKSSACENGWLTYPIHRECELQRADLLGIAVRRLDVLLDSRAPGTVKRQLGEATRVKRPNIPRARQAPTRSEPAVRDEQRPDRASKPTRFMRAEVKAEARPGESTTSPT